MDEDSSITLNSSVNFDATGNESSYVKLPDQIEPSINENSDYQEKWEETKNSIQNLPETLNEEIQKIEEISENKEFDEKPEKKEPETIDTKKIEDNKTEEKNSNIEEIIIEDLLDDKSCVIEDDEILTVARKSSIQKEIDEDDEDDDDDDEDETLAERLIGLTEMFPECVRNATYSIATSSAKAVDLSYNFSRSFVWILSSSLVIFVAPAVFEIERNQMQKELNKQMLLGPGATPGSGMVGMPPPPSASR